MPSVADAALGVLAGNLKLDSELVIGMGILLVMSTLSNPIDWGEGWVWPIPRLTPSGPAGAATPPVISQEWRTGPHEHLGVDLMYRSTTRGFQAPPGVPILAARAGRVWSIDQTPRGWAIVLDHGPPWATFYQHLSQVEPALMQAGKGAPVEPGQALGIMGSDPTDGGHVRHLHFATWYKGSGDAASVDPGQAMASWPQRIATAGPALMPGGTPTWILTDQWVRRG